MKILADLSNTPQKTCKIQQTTEDYQSTVNTYGEPISEGLYQNMDGGYYYSWSWGDDNCLSVSCSDCSYLIGGWCD